MYKEFIDFQKCAVDGIGFEWEYEFFENSKFP